MKWFNILKFSNQAATPAFFLFFKFFIFNEKKIDQTNINKFCFFKNRIDVTDVPKATTAEIRSSKEDPPINPAVIQRRNRAIVIRTTVTSTLTSYSFTSTVISKTVSLITGSNLLICRPPGFAVC